MFAKISSSKFQDDRKLTESLADVLFEIGKDLLDKKEIDIAITWLERSLTFIENGDLRLLSAEAGELRLTILHTLGETVCLLTRIYSLLTI